MSFFFEISAHLGPRFNVRTYGCVGLKFRTKPVGFLCCKWWQVFFFNGGGVPVGE